MVKFLRCARCGKILAVVNDRPVPTICCGEPMKELEANPSDGGAVEKHVPVYVVEGHIVKVKVGEVQHPSVENHYIMWILVQTDRGNQRKQLAWNDNPEAEFALLPGEKVVAVYAFCNLHGLYKA